MAVKKCVICDGAIEEEYGKIQGIMIKMVDTEGKGSNESKKSRWIYVCTDCQKDPKHMETAKVRGA